MGETGGGGGGGSEVSLVHLRMAIFGSGHEVAGTKKGMRGEGRDEMGPPADQY